MSSLVERLASRLPAGAIHLNSPVESISRLANRGWQVTLAGERPADALALCFDGLIVAAPAPQAGRMLQGLDRELATTLQSIPHAGTAIVTVAYPRQQIAHPLDGFGFVVPEVERRRILAGSFSSLKFEGRAPANQVLIRVFLGGAARPELIEEDDEKLRRIVTEELSELLGVHQRPLLCRIVRWRGAMPQYHVGHCQVVERIEAAVARHPGLELAGNAYHGVGIPQCVHGGENAAQRVLAQLTALGPAA
jgi:oxygen-dependent protoporphyrinogen oxidase